MGAMDWSSGTMKISKPLDAETKQLIDGIGTTRRMSYDVN